MARKGELPPLQRKVHSEDWHGLAIRGGIVHAPWDPSTRIKRGDMILEIVASA
jgi:hypothetical protein